MSLRALVHTQNVWWSGSIVACLWYKEHYTFIHTLPWKGCLLFPMLAVLVHPYIYLYQGLILIQIRLSSYSTWSVYGMHWCLLLLLPLFSGTDHLAWAWAGIFITTGSRRYHQTCLQTKGPLLSCECGCCTCCVVINLAPLQQQSQPSTWTHTNTTLRTSWIWMDIHT